MADNWVKRWDVPGSNGKTWTVAINMAGNYGCSCPVWKFKRRDCKHIDQVKAGFFCPKEYRSCRPANVGEVQIKGKLVYYPLVPFNNDEMYVNLRMTIVFDLLRADVDPDLIKDYKDRIIGKGVSYTEIMDHVRGRGRVIFSRFVTGQGWVDPIYVVADSPLKAVS